MGDRGRWDGEWIEEAPWADEEPDLDPPTREEVERTLTRLMATTGARRAWRPSGFTAHERDLADRRQVSEVLSALLTARLLRLEGRGWPLADVREIVERRVPDLVPALEALRSGVPLLLGTEDRVVDAVYLGSLLDRLPLLRTGFRVERTGPRPTTGVRRSSPSPAWRAPGERPRTGSTGCRPAAILSRQRLSWPMPTAC